MKFCKPCFKSCHLASMPLVYALLIYRRALLVAATLAVKLQPDSFSKIGYMPIFEKNI